MLMTWALSILSQQKLILWIREMKDNNDHVLVDGCMVLRWWFTTGESFSTADVPRPISIARYLPSTKTNIIKFICNAVSLTIYFISDFLVHCMRRHIMFSQSVIGIPRLRNWHCKYTCLVIDNRTKPSGDFWIPRVQIRGNCVIFKIMIYVAILIIKWHAPILNPKLYLLMSLCSIGKI